MPPIIFLVDAQYNICFITGKRFIMSQSPSHVRRAAQVSGHTGRVQPRPRLCAELYGGLGILPGVAQALAPPVSRVYNVPYTRSFSPSPLKEQNLPISQKDKRINIIIYIFNNHSILTKTL